MPSVDVRLKGKDKAEMTAIAKFFTQMNFPMTCGCCYNGGKYGLISGHAYSLLDIKEVNYNGKTTLIKIRNPWSKEKYNGPWRDNDPRWTD